MRRSESATAGGNRKIVFECTHCNRAESELRSVGGALIRWRNFKHGEKKGESIKDPNGDAVRNSGEHKRLGNQQSASDAYTELQRLFGYVP